MDLRAIYDEHVQFVWRSLRRLGVRDADVADAAQEVFLVAFRRMDEFEGRAKMTTWLYRICFRVAADRRRLAHVRREVLHASETLEALAPTSAAQHDDLAVLDALLDSLDLEQRAVFTLFELEGFTGPEVAEIVDAPLATVYSRLRLAREAFEVKARRLRAREGRTAKEGFR